MPYNKDMNERTEMNDGTYLKLNGQFIKAHPESGYWVAVYKTTLDDILDGQYVGVWTNPVSDVTYYDRSVWVADRNDAITLGITNNQLAIWDIANEKEIWINEFLANVFKDEQ